MTLPLSMGTQCGGPIVEAGRAPCVANQSNRVPFFGETHAHTTLSFVAAMLAIGLLLRARVARLPTWAVRIPVYAMGSLAAYWCIERAALLIP